MMDELDEFARLGADVPALPDGVRAQARTLLLARASQQPDPQARRGRAGWRPGRRLVAAAAAAVAAVAGVVAVPLLTGGSPAYAVTKQADGTVLVEIHDLDFRQPKELEASLRKAGVPAVVDLLEPGQQCGQSRGKAVMDVGGAATGLSPGPGGNAKFYGERINPARLKPGQTLVFEAALYPEYGGLMLAVQIVQGPVSPCHPTPA